MEGLQRSACLLVILGSIICNAQHWDHSRNQFNAYRQPHQPIHHYDFRHRPPGAYNPWQSHHNHHQQHLQQPPKPHNPWEAHHHQPHSVPTYTAPEHPHHHNPYAESARQAQPANVEHTYMGDCTYHGQYLAHPSSPCRYLQCSDMSVAGWRTDDLPCPPGMAARPDLGNYGYPCKLDVATCPGKKLEKPEPSTIPEPNPHPPIYDSNGQYIPEEVASEVGHVNHAHHIPEVPEYHTVEHDYETIVETPISTIDIATHTGGFIEVLHGPEENAKDMLQTYHKITAVPPIAESIDVILYEENKKLYEEEDEQPNHSVVETMEDGMRMVVEEMHEDRPGYHMKEKHTKKIMDNGETDGKKMEYSSSSFSKESSSESKPEVKRQNAKQYKPSSSGLLQAKPAKADQLRLHKPDYSAQPDYGYSYGVPELKQKQMVKKSFVHMPHIPQNIMELLQGMKDMFARQGWGRR